MRNDEAHMVEIFPEDPMLEFALRYLNSRADVPYIESVFSVYMYGAHIGWMAIIKVSGQMAGLPLNRVSIPMDGHYYHKFARTNYEIYMDLLEHETAGNQT